jgi:nicotinate phosphoribosyltransferase
VQTTALRTDHYELTMLAAARRSGVADHRAAFEVFARELPTGRRYGVFAGTGRLAAAIAAFRFDDETLAFLERAHAVDTDTLAWLRSYRFEGDVIAYDEGDTYFPDSPVLRVEATFAQAVLLETLVLSVLNHDTAVASAAARMSVAAGDATLIDMGGRRTHEDAAVDAARAAYVAGFHATSNLEAGRRYGIATTGTAAHAFVLAHDDEYDAFVAQIRALGIDTTLLVDTYDIPNGIHVAVDAARSFGASGPGAIRIDSGNLPEEARHARTQLDALGATGTRIVVSGDLDEYSIAALESDPAGRAPIAAYGVGTRLVTGSGHPTAGFVYKLVGIADVAGDDAPLRPVAKRSAAKATVGNRKTAFRVLDDDGYAVGETLTIGDAGPDGARPLQRPVVSRGEPSTMPSLADVRAQHFAYRRELPPGVLDLAPGEPALRAELHEGSMA